MKDIKFPKTPSLPTTKTTKMIPYPSCLRPPSTTPTLNHHPPPPQTTTTNPNLTTSLYQTHLGIFSLTWSRSRLTRSLHLNLHSTNSPSATSSTSPSFHLTLKPFLFWHKQGIKKLLFCPSSSVWVFWDLTNARFGSGPEPESGYYIAVLSQGEMTLLVGDMDKEAYLKTGARNFNKSNKKPPSLALRREHVVGKNKFFTTKTDLGGKPRLIYIELNEHFEEDPRLVIKFDQKRVLQVKHLKWKFRGNERIDVDGHPIQLSWDVHNWLFDQEEGNQDDGYALFTFRFEKQGKQGNVEVFEGGEIEGLMKKREKMSGVMLSQDSCGLNFERKKMKKKLMVKKTRSSSFSSSSLSSVSSGCSSVMDWESVEENELKEPTGFSLLVYAWKS